MNTPAAPAVAMSDGSALARRAAAAVAACLAGRPADGRIPPAASLRAVGATFVTLERHGALMGCIGSLDAARPRYLDAMRNAVRAASDPRLPPVTAAQWPDVDVTVSVLSEPAPLPAGSLAELIELVRPDIDGLIIRDEQRRATFLPAVWRKLPDPERFVAALLHKGGWSRRELDGPGRTRWPAGLAVSRYAAAEFTDPAPRSTPVAMDHDPSIRPQVEVYAHDR